MSQQLPDGDRFLAPLGELRPIGANPLLVVEPTPGMRERQCHRGHALGRRVHDDHGVLLPWLPGRLVANAAPQVDDLLAVAVDAACRPQLVAAGEVLWESVAHGLKSLADVSLNLGVYGGCRRHDVLGIGLLRAHHNVPMRRVSPCARSNNGMMVRYRPCGRPAVSCSAVAPAASFPCHGAPPPCA